MITFITKGHVIASIIALKEEYFQELFVTFEEANYIMGEMQKIFNENGKEVIITDTINPEYFSIKNVFLPKKEIYEIKDFYSHIPNINILNVLWNKEVILSLLIKYYKERIAKLEKREAVLIRLKDKKLPNN